MDPDPFLRGRAFPGTKRVPYPRADPRDAARLPMDTWAQAQIPVGVRLEIVGDARAVEISYRTTTDELGYRGDGAGRTFAVWRKGALVGEQGAELGEALVLVELGGGPSDERAIVYLPEGMKPAVVGIEAVDGSIEPAPRQPRWIAYGDSIAEGWIASAPALAWPAIAGREQGLDVTNLGYAGAARGEIVSAEHIAGLEADVISITHGTNCWTRIPHSTGMFREGFVAFLDVVRHGHPSTPILVAGPVVRPDAEHTPNGLGATLADLREVMEEIAATRRDVTLVPGIELLEPSMLGDGVHPNDEGHRTLATKIGRVFRGIM